MENKIKRALEEIKAEDTMKADVTAFLMQKAPKKKPQVVWRSLAVATACVACLVGSMFGGFQVHQTYAQAAYVEMSGAVGVGVSLNSKNQVIKVVGTNENGETLVSELELKNLTYEEAIAKILNSELYQECTSPEDEVEISIECEDEQSEEALQQQTEHACVRMQQRRQKHNQAEDSSEEEIETEEHQENGHQNRHQNGHHGG